VTELQNVDITQLVYRNSGVQEELYNEVLGDLQAAPSKELSS